jgi:tRNA(Ile2) C34 agmatinyltransferase TiaS
LIKENAMAKGDYILLKCDCGTTRKVKGFKVDYQCPKCREYMWDFIGIGNYERDREAKKKAKELTDEQRSLTYILTGVRI